MTVDLSTFDPVLSRQLIAISGFSNGAVRVERSLTSGFNLASIVRGGVALPISGGVGQLWDAEFHADMLNHYRVTQASLEDVMEVYSASDTWTKADYPGLVAVWGWCVGPGAGGGGCATTAAGEAAEGAGGGAGEIRPFFVEAASLGTTETITIPTGGAGGTAGANNGSAGSGSTSFGSHVSAGSGVGGAGGAATSTNNQNGGGTGGTGGSGGLLSIPGEFGENGTVRSAQPSFANRGGGCMFGPGARTAHSFATNGTTPAGGFGGGGSGGRNNASQGTARSGGAGRGGGLILNYLMAT
jgi:hypothetical protein